MHEHGEHEHGEMESEGTEMGHHGWGHGAWHHKGGMGMMGGMGMCPMCGGMMGRGTCPMCGGMMGMGMGPMGGQMMGMGMCPICGRIGFGIGLMVGRKMGKGMWPKHGGMMGEGTCPKCGRPMGMEEEEGPNRGKGPAKRTDDQIREDIEEALTDDSWLDASNVNVSVQNGIATLSGTVASREDKCRAEDLADEILGVRDIQNNLQIAGL